MKCKETRDAGQWCNREFSSLDLGDQRLNKRLVTTAERLLACPEASINQVCMGWSETKAAYRLFDNDQVSSQKILLAHQKQAGERFFQENVVLAIQDTTYFKFDALVDNRRYQQRKRFEGMHGIVMHHSIGVSPNGVTLGILSQELYDRNIGSFRNDHYEHQKIPIEEKESFRWIKALRACHDIGKPKGIKFVTICDRESDIYEFLQEAYILDEPYVIRAAKDRCLWNGKSRNEPSEKIWKKVEKTRVKGQLKVNVSRQQNRKEREATVNVRFAPLTLRPPQRKAGAQSEDLFPLEVYGILVREQRPPKGETPIEWFLLTNLKIKNFDGAVEKIRWYEKRWTIESYHKVMKSGFKVEKSQLQSVDRLNRYITLISILAVRVQAMTYLARLHPESTCEALLTKDEWQALDCKINRKPQPQRRPPTLETAVLWIAILGGYLNRNSDPPPGSMIIWRGWKRLTDVTDDWKLFRQTYG